MERIVGPKKVVIFGVLADSILNFRFDLIKYLLSYGYQVEVIVSKPSIALISNLDRYGVKVHALTLKSRSYNIVNLFKSYYSFIKIIKMVKPDLIISYTIKPIIISAIAKKKLKNFKLIVLFEGLGSVFDGISGFKLFIKKVVIIIYKIFIKEASSVVFLNGENRLYFESLNISSPKQSYLINGIGINLDKFYFKPVNSTNKIVFLLIARLIKEKGVEEFIEAAKIIKSQFPKTEFRIIGSSENRSILLDKILQYEKEKIVSYYGALEDVREQIISSSVFVLPTFYNEGLPRTILESMAMGRAIVTTNTPGCNQTVMEGENGFFVKPMDTDNLVKVLMNFINNPSLIVSMGIKSRNLAEAKFSSNEINEYFLKQIINPLLENR